MLQVRYHPKFEFSKDTLLFAGSYNDINRLRSFFLTWKGEQADLIEQLQVQEKVYLYSVAALHVGRTTKPSVIDWHGDNGTWLLTLSDQEQIVGLLDGMLATERPGHQYLDCMGTVQIMVAKDEYPEL